MERAELKRLRRRQLLMRRATIILDRLEKAFESWDKQIKEKRKINAGSTT